MTFGAELGRGVQRWAQRSFLDLILLLLFTILGCLVWPEILAYGLNLWLAFHEVQTLFVIQKQFSAQAQKLLLASQEYFILSYLLVSHSLLTCPLFNYSLLLINGIFILVMAYLIYKRQLKPRQRFRYVFCLIKIGLFIWIDSEDYLQLPWLLEILLIPWLLIYLFLTPKLLIFKADFEGVWNHLVQYWVYFLGYISIPLLLIIGGLCLPWLLALPLYSLGLMSIASQKFDLLPSGSQTFSSDPVDLLEMVSLKGYHFYRSGLRRTKRRKIA